MQRGFCDQVYPADSGLARVKRAYYHSPCSLPATPDRDVPHFPHLSGPGVCEDFGGKRVRIGNLLFIYLIVFNPEAGFFGHIFISDLCTENGCSTG